MSERNTVVYQRVVDYKGLINVPGVFRVIEDWLRQNGYSKKELRNEEEIFESGKQIILELLPYRLLNPEAKLEIHLVINFRKLQEAEVEDGVRKKKLWKGEVTITTDAYVVTDLENKWDNNAVMLFMKTIFDKFIYKVYSSHYDKMVGEDVDRLLLEVRSYLNLQRF
ncbi:MAG: hypothetical protein H6502_03920 [Candidatus Woesearchaeota archaeon]|nr:MAG: hypothetical protein H6502_03920 [Candidatus Woesearchaeota archaeon]